MEEDALAVAGEESSREGRREEMEAQPEVDIFAPRARSGGSVGTFGSHAPEDLRAGDLASHVKATRPNRGLT